MHLLAKYWCGRAFRAKPCLCFFVAPFGYAFFSCRCPRAPAAGCVLTAVLRLQVTARGKKLAELGAGAYFGEIALLKNVNCTASVTCSTDSLLLVLHRPEFNLLLESIPELKTQLDAYVASRTGNRIASLKVRTLRSCSLSPWYGTSFVLCLSHTRMPGQVPLFRGIPEPQLVRLSEVATYKRYDYQYYGL